DDRRSAFGSHRFRVASLPRQPRRSGAGGPDAGFLRPHPREQRRHGAGGFPERNEQRNETMSGFLNRVQLIGNLGRDPEVRTMQNGGQVVTLSIATTESWKDDRSGERRERTEWHRVVIFNDGLGKIAERYLQKGAKVYLEGKLTTRKWQDQSGADRYSTEIHLTPFNGVLTFLDSRRDGERPSGGEPAGAAGHSGDPDDE